MSIDVGVNILFELIYSRDNDNAKKSKAWRYCLPKGIITNYKFIINGKNLYYQSTDSDIKRCELIRKLTTGLKEDYAESFLDYEYTKNNYKLTSVDLNRQKIWILIQNLFTN